MKKPAAKSKRSSPAGFAGERLAEAAEKQPRRQLKKSVGKFKPGRG